MPNGQQSANGAIRNLFEAIWKILCQLSPWLLVGMVVSGLMHVLLPNNFVRRQFRGFAGVFKSVVIGIPLPLCSCGVIPAGIGLKNDGADDGAAIGFLISTPQTGIDSILVSVSFFGWPFAIFKMISALVMGVIGGLIANIGGAQIKTDASELPQVSMSSNLPESEVLAHRFKFAIWRMIEHSIEIYRSFWFWLLIGVLVSAAIEVWIPSSWLEGMASLGNLPSMLISLLISAPLYVCATASVPMASALVVGGLPPSAALVFLVAGPATNTTTIGSIYGRFGFKIVAVYLSVILVGSLAGGALFDWLLYETLPATGVAGHQHSGIIPPISAAIVILLSVYCAFTRFNSASSKPIIEKSELFMPISGMHCDGCAKSIFEALRSEFGDVIEHVHFEPSGVQFARQIPDDEILVRIDNKLRASGHRLHRA